MKSIKGVYIIIICLFLTACNNIINEQQEPPEAIEGVIDLRDWDFEQDGSINLAGEWAFFWDELLEPEQIPFPIQAPYVSVPGAWSKYDIEGITFTPEGYATFYLILYPPDTHQVYGLYIDGQGSAYALWVDDRLLVQNGRVDTNQLDMTPEKNPSQLSSSLLEKRWRWFFKYRTSITARAASETTFYLVWRNQFIFSKCKIGL
ncbi:MAG: hypothetical protein FVQ83_11935 [Chloroflexi bacterium]|nr:hypothetical protein [Chloroflexota bacterium]